jgi:hypothetical protein
MLQRLLKPVAPKGLEQVVDRVDLERLERVFIVRGHEDHGGHLVRA